VKPDDDVKLAAWLKTRKKDSSRIDTENQDKMSVVNKYMNCTAFQVTRVRAIDAEAPASSASSPAMRSRPCEPDYASFP